MLTAREIIKMKLRQKQICNHHLKRYQDEMEGIDKELSKFDPNLVAAIQKQIEKEDKECLSALKI